MSWEARLKELGQTPNEGQVGWLDKFLYEEDVLVDALIWKDELLTLTTNRIIHMGFKDGGKNLWYLHEGFLDNVTGVSYTSRGELRVGWGHLDAVTTDVQLTDRLVKFYKSLIKAVGHAKARK